MIPADINLSKEHLEFLTKVGEGGYGEVWKGKWNGSGGGITVAIKKIKVTGITPKAQKTIFSEVEILSKLRHPNIVTIYGACLSQTQELLIVMKFMEGGSLFDLLHSEVELGWDARTRLAHQAAMGVNVLHSREPCILHRDIKSLNFLVSKDGSILKLTDFGMSKVNSFATSTTSTEKEAIGTIRWAAPETYGNANWTTKADIYSLGVTLYEIATRTVPFVEIPDNMRVMFHVHNLQGRPEIPDECPQDIAELIKDCWHNNPDHRPTALVLVSSLALIASKYASPQPPASNESVHTTAVPSEEFSPTPTPSSEPPEPEEAAIVIELSSEYVPPEDTITEELPLGSHSTDDIQTKTEEPHKEIDAAVTVEQDKGTEKEPDKSDQSKSKPTVASAPANNVALSAYLTLSKKTGSILVSEIHRLPSPPSPLPPPLTSVDLPPVINDGLRFSRISRVTMIRPCGINLPELSNTHNLKSPSLLCYNPNENALYAYDVQYILKVSMSNYEVTYATLNFLEGIQGICINFKENTMYATSTKRNVIFKISLSDKNACEIFAGTLYGYRDGENTSACFAEPQGITIDQQTGALYVADTGNKAIRMITPQGTVSTIATLEFPPYGISFCEKEGFMLVNGFGRVCSVTLKGRAVDVVRTGAFLGTAIKTQFRTLFCEPSPYFCAVTNIGAGGYRLTELTTKAGRTLGQISQQLGKFSRAFVCVESEQACFVCSDRGIYKIIFAD